MRPAGDFMVLMLLLACNINVPQSVTSVVKYKIMVGTCENKPTPVYLYLFVLEMA